MEGRKNEDKEVKKNDNLIQKSTRLQKYIFSKAKIPL
jgi:hypothetical protein